MQLQSFLSFSWLLAILLKIIFKQKLQAMPMILLLLENWTMWKKGAIIKLAGLKFGYCPNATKTWLIMKDSLTEKTDEVFKDTGIKWHCKACIIYVLLLVTKHSNNSICRKRLTIGSNRFRLLGKIAYIEPQAAYCGFVTGFKHQMSYSMWTIPGINDQLRRRDNGIWNKFIWASTEGLNCSVEMRKLLLLPPR